MSDLNDNELGEAQNHEPQPIPIDIEAIKSKLHAQVIEFLDISENKLTIEAFSTYIGMVEMLLELKGIELKKLSTTELTLLLIFYTGCQLKKTGAVVDVGSAIIKSRKLNEMEISYHLPRGSDSGGGSGAKTNILDQILISNDFCANFDAMLSTLAETTAGISTKYQCFGGAK